MSRKIGSRGFIAKAPAPKGKIQQKRSKSRPKIKRIDVFKAVMDGDAGSESSRQPPQPFSAYLKRLSKPQITRLEKRIDQLKSLVLSENPTDNRLKELDKIEWAINRHTEKSRALETEINLAIKRRLQSLPIKKIKRNSKGNGIWVLIKGKWVEIGLLIEEYFTDIITRVDDLLSSGRLIPFHSGHKADGYVKRVLINYL